MSALSVRRTGLIDDMSAIIEVPGGTIEQGEPWIVDGTLEGRFKWIAHSAHGFGSEEFYTQSAATRALWVVDETVRGAAFRGPGAPTVPWSK